MRKRWHKVEATHLDLNLKRMKVRIQRDDASSPWHDRLVFLRKGVPWTYGYDERGVPGLDIQVSQLNEEEAPEPMKPMKETSRRRMVLARQRRHDDHTEVRPLTIQSLLVERREIQEALTAIDFDFVRTPKPVTLSYMTELRERLGEIDDVLVENYEQNIVTAQQQEMLDRIRAMTPAGA